ncbi:MAG: hypothetical protein ABUS57_06375 [Pseudomonadota bacterium]
MRVSANPVSDHRLARLMRWAGLWLIWVAVWELGFHGESAGLGANLARVRRGVLDVLIVYAAARVTPPVWRRKHFDARDMRGGVYRAVVGGRLRRLLCKGPLLDQVLALWRLIRNPEPAIAVLSAQLLLLSRRCKLTRFTPFVPGVPPALSFDVSAADSS